jgi:uncharacterized membrane protein
MSNFIHTAGTGGVLGTKRTVTWATSLNALASGSRAISDTTADTGSFTQTSFSNAPLGMAYFTTVTTGWTPTAGGCFACWFLPSYDGGTTYEVESRTTPSTTVPAVARAPDFIIPVYTGGTAISAGDVFFAQGPFPLPYLQSKLIVQNMTGAALAATAHTINIFGVTDTFG